MYDKEIEAIAKCSELIKELDEESRVRVIKYLIERFGIGMQKQSKENFYLEPNGYKDVSGNGNEIEFENNENLPNLRDLIVKDFPKNESEWVLIYGFYVSNNTEGFFSRDDLIEKYNETSRRTDTRIKNLTQSLTGCIRKDWIKSVNNKEYMVTEIGKQYVKDILSGNSSGSTRKKYKNPGKRKNEKE